MDRMAALSLPRRSGKWKNWVMVIQTALLVAAVVGLLVVVGSTSRTSHPATTGAITHGAVQNTTPRAADNPELAILGYGVGRLGAASIADNPELAALGYSPVRRPTAASIADNPELAALGYSSMGPGRAR